MSHYLNSSGREALGTLDNCVAAVERFSIGAMLRRMGCQLKIWDRRYRQRQQLREMDPALLRDIGVSEVEAEAEAAKPFWRA